MGCTINKISKIRTVAILVIIIAAVFVYREDIISLFNDNIPATEEKTYAELTVKVLTQDVSFTNDNRVFEAIGTGRARQSVEIYPSVAEEVTSVLFKARDKVAKGKLLVQLDDREEKLAVKLAEVKLKDTNSLLRRYEQAVKEGAVPESEVDSARADVESARVALDQARLALKERKIIAPFSGVVGIPRVDQGDRVGTDTLITGLDDLQTIYVDFEVPEALADALKKELTVTATTPAYPGKVFSGVIIAQETRIDPEKRTILVRANIDNTEDLLRPGMSFTTRWEITGSEYPTVPEIALQWERDGSFVWIIRGERAKKVRAQVVARTAGKVLLKGDISEGEPVVIEGLERLDQDTKVTILGNSRMQSENQVEEQ